jgi:hypothetical protein
MGSNSPMKLGKSFFQKLINSWNCGDLMGIWLTISIWMRMLIISFHPYTGVSKKRQYFPYSFCVSNFSISLVVALCMYICRHIDMDIDIDVDIAIDVDIDVDTHLAIVKPKGTARIWGSLCWQAQPLGGRLEGELCWPGSCGPAGRGAVPLGVADVYWGWVRGKWPTC